MRICFGWNEFPFYASSCISHVISRTKHEVKVVVANKAKAAPDALQLTPVAASVDPQDTTVSWSGLGLETPDVFIQSGWNVPALTRLGRQTRRAGGAVVCMMDNIRRKSLKQSLGRPLIKAKLRASFDAFFVPGSASAKLLEYWGVRSSRIFTGMYGANPTLFQALLSGTRDMNRILFVGQFIHRKGLDILLSAFEGIREIAPEATLVMIGDGNIRVSPRPNLVVKASMPSREIALEMARSAIFVLPSREDHWGVVLHEAALSGCILVASSTTGAAFDLITEETGRVFPAEDAGALSMALQELITLSDEEKLRMGRSAAAKGREFGPERFAQSVEKMLDILSR